MHDLEAKYILVWSRGTHLVSFMIDFFPFHGLNLTETYTAMTDDQTLHVRKYRCSIH